VAAVDDGGRLVPTGTPTAVLEIPRLGVRGVVGVGTSSDALKSGPGHLRDSPMPGQAGASVILGGRRAGCGAAGGTGVAAVRLLPGGAGHPGPDRGSGPTMTIVDSPTDSRTSDYVHGRFGENLR
jgi:hypothetical protein